MRVYLRWKYGQEKPLMHIEPMLSVRQSEALEDEIRASGSQRPELFSFILLCFSEMTELGF